jgi:hypothetical protein
MTDSPCNDQTRYKALYTGHWHSMGDIHSRKRWNDAYMIDVKQHSDFIKVEDNE